MKLTKNLLFSTFTCAILSLAGQLQAQYQAVCDDGISASPKMREWLNEQHSRVSVTSEAQGAAGLPDSSFEGIAASPKLRESLAEQQVAVTTESQDNSYHAGYQPTGEDGITASPKFRQLLNEQNARKAQWQ